MVRTFAEISHLVKARPQGTDLQGKDDDENLIACFFAKIGEGFVFGGQTKAPVRTKREFFLRYHP
jgi:hypothetical protein